MVSVFIQCMAGVFLLLKSFNALIANLFLILDLLLISVPFISVNSDFIKFCQISFDIAYISILSLSVLFSYFTLTCFSSWRS
jgi:hypothetical protein